MIGGLNGSFSLADCMASLRGGDIADRLKKPLSALDVVHGIGQDGRLPLCTLYATLGAPAVIHVSLAENY